VAYVESVHRGRCFETIKSGLHFNICHLTTSHLFNDDVVNLSALIEQFISPELFYACCFWANHIHSASDFNTSLRMLGKHVEYFFHVQLLYWLEVLSLKRVVRVARPFINSVVDMIKIHNTIAEHRHNTKTIHRAVIQSLLHLQ
jgi:hypothetical protein